MANKQRASVGKMLRALLWRAWSNFYVRHLLLAFCTILLLLLGVNLWLMIYTRHGQSELLPNFIGLSLHEAQLLAADDKLRLEITDSVYIAYKPRGSVIEQNPHPNVMVKENRTVFLTMNAMVAKRVPAPDVEGVSLRQAKSTIEQQGLTVGRLTFVSGFSGNVIGQKYRGQKLEGGEMLVVGSHIDLLVGKNMGERTAIPSLKGMTLTLARSAIIEGSLNVGRVRFDSSVQTALDSLEAKVYSQYPLPNDDTTIDVGASVDVFLTVNESRLE